MLYFEVRKLMFVRVVSEHNSKCSSEQTLFSDKQIPACLQSPFALQSDMCSLAAFWGKHHLPETEILIWCHAALVKLHRQKHTHICFVKTHKGSMCCFVIETL